MNRIEELENIITKAQKAYYSGNGVSELSDAEFDAYWDELKNLDPNNEIFNQVGSDLGESNGFPKVKHNIIMGSQSKANTAEEMNDFIAKNPKNDSYIVSYKMDGSSVVLDYVNGKLIRGASRGDGTIGVDYTENIKKMGGVVQTLKVPFTGSVRGEVLLSKSNKEKYFKDAPNCRNMATGIFHHIDGSDCEKLDVIVYDAQYLDKSKSFVTQNRLLSFLVDNDFKVAPFTELQNLTGEKAMAHLANVWAHIDAYDYDIDGLVFKTNKIDMNDITTNYRPTTQIALKPARTLVTTTLENIEWQVRNGTLTPVAILKPVSLLGATIKKASLANLSLIMDLGLEIGDEVVIARTGEIIPKILKNVRTGKIAPGYEASFIS